MGRLTKFIASGLAGLALLGMAGCELVMPVEPVLTPKARPLTPNRPAPPVARALAPSEESAALRMYYAQVLQDGLTRGLLRTDGGGPDTPYTSDMLLRNFEQIAFFSEYERGNQPLRRWVEPVRIEARFAPSIAPATRTRDANALTAYVARLARLTRHPIAIDSTAPNFHIFFVGEDERSDAVEQIRRIDPRIDANTLNSIRNLSRSTYCLVVALTDANNSGTYRRAIAVIRAEQPDLMRLSCIHEEVAQGLGLANDSPYARPSIFNDDDEFALLTTHDEQLLTLLYDPRLKVGMSAQEALPIARSIVSGLLAGPT